MDDQHPAIKLWERISDSVRWKDLWDVLELEGVGMLVQRGEDDSHTGVLTITIGKDRDAWIQIDGSGHLDGSLRFCTSDGRGQSPRVRKALVQLAIAMLADNVEYPDPRRSG